MGIRHILHRHARGPRFSFHPLHVLLPEGKEGRLDARASKQPHCDTVDLALHCRVRSLRHSTDRWRHGTLPVAIQLIFLPSKAVGVTHDHLHAGLWNCAPSCLCSLRSLLRTRYLHTLQADG